VRSSLQFISAFLCLLVGLLGGLIALSSSATAAPPQSSAQQLLSHALSAAQKAGSMHFVDKTTVSKTSQTLEGVVSASTAGETLNGSTPLQVDLIGGSIYVMGSAGAIQQALQITASQAASYAQKWIVVSTNDVPFRILAQDLTMRAAINGFMPVRAGASLGKERKLGQYHVIPVVGRPSKLPSGTSGSVALFVSAKAPHVPLGGTLVLANKKARLSEVAIFNDWGTKVSLTAPTAVTAYTTLVANPSG
jgi:hypothetical protein